MRKLLVLLGGLFVSLFSSGVAIAAAEGAAAGGDSQVKAAIAIAAGLAVAIAAFGAALGPRARGRRRDGKHRPQSECRRKVVLTVGINSGAARSFGALWLRHRDYLDR